MNIPDINFSHTFCPGLMQSEDTRLQGGWFYPLLSERHI